jgi:uncharacterized protein (TIGR03086 family)
MDLIEVHNRALDQTQILVGGVETNQMVLPTPCQEWDVRELLNHIVGGNRSYAGIARRDQRRRAPGEDVLGDDPVEAYRQSAKDCKQAWSDPLLLDEMLPSHLGEMSGRTILGIHLVETVGHGWDLATATGQQTQFDPDIVQAAMEIVQGVLTELPRGTWFGPQREVSDDLSEIDRLAAFLGRSLVGDKA